MNNKRKATTQLRVSTRPTRNCVSSYARGNERLRIQRKTRKAAYKRTSSADIYKHNNVVTKQEVEECREEDDYEVTSGMDKGCNLGVNDETMKPNKENHDPQTCLILNDVAKVKNNLRIFNMYYLQAIKEEKERCLSTEEEDFGKQKSQKPGKRSGKNGDAHGKNKSRKPAKCCLGKEEDFGKRKSRRPDLQAISKMHKAGAILYPDKMIGIIPGVNVGDHFFSRCEMSAIGLHHHWLNGIDYMAPTTYKKSVNYKLPLAISIVMSGGYEDDVDKSEEVVYTGQGGNDLTGNRRQIKDQKMDKGNLALKNCIEEGTPVRVIRGHDSNHSYTKRVYTYDGLYKVVEYWAEQGISGFTVFKYKLKRDDGQPALTTDQVHFCRGRIPDSPAELRGLVCEDISNGLEKLPVPASNIVDDPPLSPLDGSFVYTELVEAASSVEIPPPATGCSCKGGCFIASKCSCAQRNGGVFPYVDSHGGRLAVPLDVVYECGPNCGCDSSCINRTTQHGLRYRLEVFRTLNKGWGVRSWDSIPAGAPICEYTGCLIRSEDAEFGNQYIFDLDCMQTMRGVDGRQRRWGDVLKLINDQNGNIQMEKQDEDMPHAEFSVDAKHRGGVARFINHSCEPNLFVQCVLSSHDDIRLPRLVLFAADNIPPLQELSYDYGYPLDSVIGEDGKVKKSPCYCGAIGCRKRLY